MPHLFDSLTLRGVTFRNRIGVSPMCQYSAVDGLANDWHFVHLGSRAVSGAGLVIVEATAIAPEGRISPADMGLWSDAHIEPLARIVRYMKAQGTVPGIQISHAGRKASTAIPWMGGGGITPDQGGWTTFAPSAIPFNERYPLPEAMTHDQIQASIAAFRDTALRALAAGFEVLELHGAHGYLIHSFLSPLSNARTDAYGGSLENRMRYALEVTRAVRAAWPEDMPLFMRLSCSDWVEGGWTIEESVTLSRHLRAEGVDLVDCSSGGGAAKAMIPVGAGYQVPFAEAIRRGAEVPTAAVGMISAPSQADEIIRNGRADMVLMAREFLRDPYWPIHAAHTLGHKDKVAIPSQYLRAF